MGCQKSNVKHPFCFIVSVKVAIDCKYCSSWQAELLSQANKLEDDQGDDLVIPTFLFLQKYRSPRPLRKDANSVVLVS